MLPTHDAQTVRRASDDLPGVAAAAIAMALAGLFIAALAFATSYPSTVGGPAEAPAPQEVRDGWSSYLGAAAPEREIVDGWSSYLTPTVPAVRDGWSSYLLAPEIDPNTVVDGWMSRHGSRDD